MLCGREMLILDLFAHPLTDHPDQASRWIGAPLPFSTRIWSRSEPISTRCRQRSNETQMITGAQETAAQTRKYDQDVTSLVPVHVISLAAPS